ncbi:MAG: DUF445 family protein [Candidatus Izimaplasma sp.]|nr:DUF445 family protein [Candidatus Izimaplasma bacterium]
MDIIRFIVMVMIGGLIGWITNKVAIKMLFRPVNPVKILFFTFQGVFPKRKDIMAISLADTIEKELLSKEVILDKILNEENMEEVKKKIMDTLLEKLIDKIPSMVRMFLGNDVDRMMKEFFEKEGDELFNELIDKFKDTGLENLNIREIVIERIDDLDFIEFEKIIFGLMNRELKYIEVIGLILGSIIGAIQYIITIFL